MKKQQNQSYPAFKSVRARNQKQKEYIQAIESHDLTFVTSIAGTGKSYIAVACALKALKDQKVSRIVITRPVVEAGEKLGFLPGDLYEKVNPYLRPIYDAFFSLIGPEQFNEWKAQEIIEIAPLAFMRGRTLDNAFIILDEGQNTTISQMKMFLTRMGENSKVVITGDITQIDLSDKEKSGLIDALEVLGPRGPKINDTEYYIKPVEGIAFITFGEEDVVRHEMVKKIVHAYTEVEAERLKK